MADAEVSHERDRRHPEAKKEEAGEREKHSNVEGWSPAGAGSAGQPWTMVVMFRGNRAGYRLPINHRGRRCGHTSQYLAARS